MGTDWSITTDLDGSEDTSWAKADILNDKDEDRAWNAHDSVLTANVSANKDKFSGSGNFAVEELMEFPELLDIEPELIGADGDEWTILDEPS